MIGVSSCKWKLGFGKQCGQPVYYEGNDFCYYHTKVKLGLLEQEVIDMGEYLPDDFKNKYIEGDIE